MTRIEYQQRLKRMRRERAISGVMMGMVWSLGVAGGLAGRGSGTLQGKEFHWLFPVLAVVGLAAAYGVWVLWIARAVKKHDLLCPNCCRSLVVKTVFEGESLCCPHCGISIGPKS